MINMLHKIRCFSNLQSENAVHPPKGRFVGPDLPGLEAHPPGKALRSSLGGQGELSGSPRWGNPRTARAVGQWEPPQEDAGESNDMNLKILLFLFFVIKRKIG